MERSKKMEQCKCENVEISDIVVMSIVQGTQAQSGHRLSYKTAILILPISLSHVANITFCPFPVIQLRAIRHNIDKLLLIDFPIHIKIKLLHINLNPNMNEPQS
jgi:hypothetical protein